MSLDHASFFSGVGGTDLGLERAGFRTVSFSEVDPYACAVLAERWPGIPNHGSILQMAAGEPTRPGDTTGRTADGQPDAGGDAAWIAAPLWTGGFPCQDLSVAGKRRGFTGERSVLAFAFLDLVERHRPPAILLENVPGLLSSHGGRDMATLLGRMVELGYGVAYRILDAQHFGVPQRRRRVFILGLRSDPDDANGRIASERAAEVLSVGTRCARHPATGHEAGPGATDSAVPGVDIARAVTGTTGKRHDDDTDTLIGTLREHVRPGSATDYSVLSAPPDATGVRAADGLAGRPHDREQLAFVKSARPKEFDGEESWIEGRVMPTLNAFDVGDVRTTAAIVQGGEQSYHQRDRVYGSLAPALDAYGDTPSDSPMVAGGFTSGDDELLPLGLDSHRYRCCGNGVVAAVAEWIGRQLLTVMEKAA